MSDPRAAISTAFLDATGPIVLVNLPYRADRRQEFASQLQGLGLSYDHPKVQVFAAIRPETAEGFPTIGTRGCFLSHLGILRKALADGWDRVLICEDDLDFADDALARLPGITARLAGSDWAMFYGGYGDTVSGTEVAPGLVKLDPASGVSCTHFYAIRGPAIADLVRYLDSMLAREPGHPDGGPMHYDGALCWFRKAHPQHMTLAAVPPIGVQRPSRTDIHDLRWFDRWPGFRSLTSLARKVFGARRGTSRT
jgi:glycosyl transferase, family 25